MNVTRETQLTEVRPTAAVTAARGALSRVRGAYRYLSLLAGLLVAIGAQYAIEQGQVQWGVLGYVVAALVVATGVPAARGAPARAREQVVSRPAALRLALAGAGLASSIATFALSGGNRYTLPGVLMWVISVACWWGVFSEQARWRASAWLREVRSRLMHSRADAAAFILFVGILALGAAFLFVNLYGNPLEMNSDHAEKLLEINQVLEGTPYIFFEQNTGREPWQFWWTVLLIRLFNLPLDFMALKIGTSLIGFLALPGIYLLAREVFGTRVALVATLFAAVASWGVLLARYGLRFPLLYCATAWTLYFLVRGLRRDERNSLLAAGVALGIGLQGYTSFRAMPFVGLLIVGLWAGWLYFRRERQAAKRALVGAGMALVLAVAVCMPLIRYGVDYPDKLLYRVATRISGLEQQVEGSVPEILLNNAKNALLMFNYRGDEVWVENLPYKPAMDPVLGALLVVGAAAAIGASVRKRDPWP
ncbi:MAG TPA: glycosyltransferase family 39 protein, partial [Chloroflexia bacterium]|nr:glycosyltransferase family 39 protein [Chloroflexia bacterium]